MNLANGDRSSIQADRPIGASVEYDLECEGCGYNLRTQSVRGSCPECGCPVPKSALPSAFKFTRWRAIRSIRVGLLLWVASILVWAAGSGYCVLRIAWAADLHDSSRWLIYHFVVECITRGLEVLAVIFTCRAFAVEWRGVIRVFAILSAALCVLSSIPMLAVGTNIFLQVQIPPQSLVGLLGVAGGLGQPAALLAVSLLIVYSIRGRGNHLPRAAAIAMPFLTGWPLVIFCMDTAQQLITGDHNYSTFRSVSYEFVHCFRVLSYILIALALLVLDRRLRPARAPNHGPIPPSCPA